MFSPTLDEMHARLERGAGAALSKNRPANAGLTSEDLAERIGCDHVWLDGLLKEMRHVQWSDDGWRLTERARRDYGRALSALPSLSSSAHDPGWFVR